MSRHGLLRAPRCAYDVITRRYKATKTKLVAIGNSRGVRIPAALIKEAGLRDEVELTLAERGLLLTPIRKPREGWAESAAAAAAAGDDLISGWDFPTEFDRDEPPWDGE